MGLTASQHSSYRYLAPAKSGDGIGVSDCLSAQPRYAVFLCASHGKPVLAGRVGEPQGSPDLRPGTPTLHGQPLVIGVIGGWFKTSLGAFAMQAASIALTGKTLLREKQIADSATPWQKSSGVYFLLKKSRVIYCGQARNIYARIPQHKDKDFDSYSYVPAPIEMLDLLESLYIHTLQPERNGKQCNGAMQAPIALDSLFKAHRKNAEKQGVNHAHPN